MSMFIHPFIEYYLRNKHKFTASLCLFTFPSLNQANLEMLATEYELGTVFLSAYFA